jgi:hypothetical protein
MNWISKHADTVIVLSGIALSVLWMSSKFHELKEEIVVMKTILIMKDIYPKELASTSSKKD